MPEDSEDITYGVIAAAAQRVVNASNALERAYAQTDHPDAVDAMHDESLEAIEALVVLLLKDSKDNQRLISLALDECALAVRAFH